MASLMFVRKRGKEIRHEKGTTVLTRKVENPQDLYCVDGETNRKRTDR